MSGRKARPSPEWDIPPQAARVEDVDQRLRSGIGRTGLLQVLIDHDTPAPGRCPNCGWVATFTRKDCPSRVIAKALIERRPFPAWLAHLVGDVPAARTKDAAQTREEQRAAEDDEPGLFPAPRRAPDPRGPR